VTHRNVARSQATRHEDSSIEERVPESRVQLLRDAGNWPLFYHTLSNMTVRQLAGVLERTVRQKAVPHLPVKFDERYEQQVPDAPTTRPEPVRLATARLRDCLRNAERERHSERLGETEAGDVTFLNTTISLGQEDGVAWTDPVLDDQPQLWSIKLYGFEFLRWLVFGNEHPSDNPEAHARCRRWLRDWARSPETAIGAEEYLRGTWTPHSVSLRILNLARYYSWCVGAETDVAFPSLLRRLIYKNALFLENHVEYEVGGNHLIENAAALVMAGVLFPDTDRGWLETGISILESAQSQFLTDGGHFERSPMYHLIALTRYLTVLDLIGEGGRSRPSALMDIAEQATGYVRTVRPPDGRIPLLNDSVFGEAIQLDSCLGYATELGIETRPRKRVLPDSGLFWLGEGDDRLLVDGGEFGPSHLPAHSHNDFLAVLWWVDGHRLLTDTGTYHYAPTSRRQYSRSVEGHNTVQVGSTEPVPVGGRYLAGRRPEPSVQYARVGDLTMFDGVYERYSLPGLSYRHRRRVFSAEDWWLLQDKVNCDKSPSLRQRLHLHPQVSLGNHPATASGYTLQVSDEPVAYVLSPDAASVMETTAPYFPEFGRERERSSLLVEPDSGTDTMSLLLSTRPYSVEEFRQLKTALTRVDHRAIEPPLAVGDAQE
jgi:uncharacterized heparinase superfamily protein